MGCSVFDGERGIGLVLLSTDWGGAQSRVHRGRGSTRDICVMYRRATRRAMVPPKTPRDHEDQCVVCVVV